MPELIEAAYYESACQPLIGHRLDEIVVDPPEFLRPVGHSPEELEVLIGLVLARTFRIGKVVVLGFGPNVGSVAAELGIRFGMTGLLFVDGTGPIDHLVYGPQRDDSSWDRATLRFAHGVLTIRDPRRLGSIELDPDLTGLGPDATSITVSELRAGLGSTRRALKAALLDQSVLAGLGNLLADEILWRCGLAPGRPASSLETREVTALHDTIATTVDELTERGGSHTGDSFDLRTPESRCHRCGSIMVRDRFGGRSTWWCPGHQS